MAIKWIHLLLLLLVFSTISKGNHAHQWVKMMQLQPATRRFSQDTATHHDPMFKNYLQFIKEYNKSYNNIQELNYRYQVFTKNMARAMLFQKHDNATGRYGFTKLSDLTDQEVKSFYAMKKWPQQLYPTKKANIPQLNSLPQSFDWRSKGAVTAVKDQKRCGACWAFATTGNIEGQWYLNKGKLYSLSEQELVDCDKIDEGCKGGLPLNAYHSIMNRLGGLETEKDYPYVAKNGKCKLNKSEEVVYINSSVKVSTNETDLAAWLVAHGPVAIGINSVNMLHYKGGIAHPTNKDCNPKLLDHGVLIVGYGEEKSTPYWIIKNSWGTDWGEKGYYRVVRGIGACGLNKSATSAIVY
ncbi:uncharacterized protein TRIADDRAFT_61245 [Trichoplax adhaerens]|uniref:Uncharacterized protein n=1 Tax=Trichoplax adhaerens TaxID=10228 RepID=B3SAF9_TRIAD|nr:hypothetical protein TRIADDRAFT_61245 [Trichoplax adhaerens]EDV20305.1 hypothetical protein TRIADDRAFT_61245 [Trichoplax adhaerens]|eukprot:XP_002117255.1 hypothetical protein TRIADDRAFT_61245 [Trichoplax adhaerens]